jgi:SAM-dependent methyltransferase
MDSTGRFSNRVNDYIRYRPGYPVAVINALEDALEGETQLGVADIGSGTGIFSELLLQRGFTVFGVEPNTDMRQAAESLLSGHSRFVSIDGTAEDTTLPAASVVLCVAAQAFHWFDAAATRRELKRILVPNGLVALIWNDRRPDATPFLSAYEKTLLSLGTDYEQVNHRNIDEAQLAAWFGRGTMRVRTFPNEQRFDWDGLYGRALSSSYVPAKTDSRHPAFANALRANFDEHNENGFVTFEYDTRLYIGALD